MSLTAEMNKSIDDLTDVVFYKPIDVELITQTIEDVLNKHESDLTVKE